MSGTIAVIVASYNRPRMLAEALASIGPCDQVILADDGSSFDVHALARQFDLPDLTFVINPPKKPKRRMTEPSCGALVNRAVALAKTDYVLACLCDDDLLERDWPRQAAAALDYYRYRDGRSRYHMVRANWGLFRDGEERRPGQLCEFNAALPLTSGNMVYRRSCATEEGCLWDETSVAIHDAQFLGDYMHRHGYSGLGSRGWLGHLDVLAGWRREHAKTVTRHATGDDRYKASAEALFAAGSME